MYTKEQFIEEVAKYVEKHRHKYNILVCSAIIAQAILESGWGTTELAVKANNFFGLKYKAGRCPTASGFYIKQGTEQNPDGTYVSYTMYWCTFADLEQCVIGYFDFINNSNYANLKGVTDPEMYIKNIKADNYATDIKYVDKILRIIKENNLTRFDSKVEEEKIMAYTNSPLVQYMCLSPNCTKPRKHCIDTITIHCVVGQVTIETLGSIFRNPSRQASSNYGVDKDGRIGLFVEECNRSWCTGGKDKNGNVIRVNGISGADNDHRAITIEVASDTVEPFSVTNKAYESLIKLVADICSRNNIKQLKWSGDKSLVGDVEKQNMTVHRWFAIKSCPGSYLYNRMGEIARRANALIQGGTSPDEPVDPSSKEVPVTYKELSVGDIVNFVGTYNYTSSGTAGKAVYAPKGKAKVTQKGNSKAAHPIHVRAIDDKGKFTRGVYGWVNICDLTKTVKEEDPNADNSYMVRITVSELNVRSGPGTNYRATETVHRNEVYTIVAESDGWGKLLSGAGWIFLKYTKRI